MKCDCTWGSYCPACQPEAFDYPPHPIVGTPEEFEEYQEAMNALFDEMRESTRDPLPEDFDDWVRQGNEHFARRFSQQA